MKLYCEIANTGNYSLVGKKGTDQQVCYQAWEEIVVQNSKASGSGDFTRQNDTLLALGRLISTYTLVDCYLLQLHYSVDARIIEELKALGFTIDTSGSKKAYAASLESAKRKLQNYRSKIASKKVELDKMLAKQESAKKLSFGELIASVSYGIGFAVPQDITLSAFNEYKKIIKAKTEAAQSLHKRR